MEDNHSKNIHRVSRVIMLLTVSLIAILIVIGYKTTKNEEVGSLQNNSVHSSSTPFGESSDGIETINNDPIFPGDNHSSESVVTSEDTPTSTSTYKSPSEKTTSSSAGRTIKLPIAHKKGEKIGSGGVAPGTHIAVLYSKTQGSVKIEKCTVAFSIKDTSQNPYAVTAGHCGEKGQKVFTLPDDNNFSSAQYLGKIVEKSDVHGSDNKNTDWAVVKLNKNARVPSDSLGIKYALNTSHKKIGDSLCKQGSRTGTSCGMKSSEGVQASVEGNPRRGYTGSKFSIILDAVRTCALPGDSGGPVYDRKGIVGVTSATSSEDNRKTNRCDSQSTQLYYSPIERVISEIHRSIPKIDIRYQ